MPTSTLDPTARTLAHFTQTDAPLSPGSRPQQSSATEKPERLASLDAYRGFIMLAMASAGFRLPDVAKRFPDNPVMQFLGFQTDHVAWAGCSFWDLIQPSFMFMVGVAIPYSYVARKAKGSSEFMIYMHTAWRAFLLVLLGVFLTSNNKPQTEWIFPIVLCQIGLGYFFVFLLRGRGLVVQSIAAGIILVGYWLAFLLWPLPPEGFDFASVGVKANWQHLPGWFAHWDKNTNVAAAFDVWFLNLFPRVKRFEFNDGGYQTLNFVPSMATMIFGLMAGEYLRQPGKRDNKCLSLAIAGVIFLIVGQVLGWTVCPLVKRIWTPSWAVYSTGWTLLMLAAFYGVIDVLGWRRWSLPLIVVGMNSIAMYVMAQLLQPWIMQTWKTHFGGWWFDPNAYAFEPSVEMAAKLSVLWLICAWMYGRKIFLKI